jgi:hypothetical protein
MTHYIRGADERQKFWASMPPVMVGRPSLAAIGSRAQWPAPPGYFPIKVEVPEAIRQGAGEQGGPPDSPYAASEAWGNFPLSCQSIDFFNNYD